MKEIEKIQEAKRKHKPVHEDVLDSRELDMILEELATICNKAQLFDRFIRLRAQVRHMSIIPRMKYLKSNLE